MPVPKIVVSWSEIDAGRQCPHKHLLAYMERWRPATEALALAKGHLWHEVLQAHYQAILTQDLALKNPRIRTEDKQIVSASRAPIHSLLHGDHDQQDDVQELIEWMYDGYVEFWGLDSEWEIVAVEHEAEVPLLRPDGEPSRFHVKMKIDLIIRDKSSRLWLVDHKSGKDLPKDKDLALDDQFGFYTWGMRQLGHKVHGAIYSAARTQRNISFQPLNTRFSRTLMYRTDDELNTIIEEAYQTVRRLYSKSNTHERHPNPDTCKWRCAFLEPCLASRKGVDEISFLQSAGYIQDFSRHG